MMNNKNKKASIISAFLIFCLVLCLPSCASEDDNPTFLSSDCYIEVIDVLNSSCSDVTPYKTDFDAQNSIFTINVTTMEGAGKLIKDNEEAIYSAWDEMSSALNGLGKAIEEHIQASGFNISVSINILSDFDGSILYKSFNGKTYNVFDKNISSYPSSSSSSSSEDYWCMGKNDTCRNKTYDPYDLFCYSCDKNGNNVEDSKEKPSYSSSSSSASSSSGSYWCMGKHDTCQNKTYSAYDFYCNKCDPDNDNIEG